jgi:predicted ATP-dependent serine protease
MGRKALGTEGCLGSLSLSKEIELMIQLLSWTDDQIFNALKIRHGELPKEATIAHIRVIRSKFRAESKEQSVMEGVAGKGTVTSLDDITDKKLVRFPCGINHVDMLWGFSEDLTSKGFPRGQISLLGGSPGVGKTRAMIAVCGSLTDPKKDKGFSALYWQNEFALEQFKTVAKGKIKKDAEFRCGDIHSLKGQLDELSANNADLVIVDSVQMLDEAKNRNGLERCIAAYKTAAIQHNCHVVLVTQLNKKDQISGSRIVEHLVDSVFLAVKDRDTGGFAIRCTKNRWGMSGVQGMFRHNSTGIEPFGEIEISEE